MLVSVRSISFVNNTLVGDGTGAGIVLDPYTTGSAWLTNTIMSNFALAIDVRRPSSTNAFADYTSFYSNTTNYRTGIASGHDLHRKPEFVNPAEGDFHIEPTSAAVDAGANTRLKYDIDGDPRPLGRGYDIGADEAWQHLFLPFATKSVSSINNAPCPAIFAQPPYNLCENLRGR